MVREYSLSLLVLVFAFGSLASCSDSASQQDAADHSDTDAASGEGDSRPEVTNDSEVSGDMADGHGSDSQIPEPKVCKVKDYGAVGDAETLDTVAFQAAVDDCAGVGGVVLVTPGIYIVGTVILKSNMTLRVEENAKIRGAVEKEAYSMEHLLYADGADNLTIEGPGTIDGNGEKWYGMMHIYGWRPHPMIRIDNSKNLVVRNIFLTMSPGWHLHPRNCDDVLIHDVKIRAYVTDTQKSPNTDGIDIDACRNVKVFSCDVETGDDAIVLKYSEPGDLPMYNVEIYDCVLSSWANAFKIGTRPMGEVRDVVFRDSIVRASVESYPGTRSMGAITLVSDAGASVHNVEVRNIDIQATHAPFFFRVQERLLDDGSYTQAGELYDVRIIDVDVKDCDLPGMVMGIDGHEIGAVSFENVTINSTEGGTESDRSIEPPERNFEYPDAVYFGKFPAYGFFARHVAGPLEFKGSVSFSSTAQEEQRPEMVLMDVDDYDLGGVEQGTTCVIDGQSSDL